MKDVLFYNNYSPEGDICTIAICVIFYLLLRSTYTIRQKNLHLFKTANFFVLLAAVSNIYYHTTLDVISTEKVIWIYVFRDTYYISMILTYAIICSYVRNLIDLKGLKKRILNIILWVGFFVFAILEVAGPLTKFGFYIDENLQIHQNYYYDIFRFAYVYYGITVMALLFTNKRKFVAKMYRCICGVMFVSFGIMIIQNLFLRTSYTCITFTFPILAVLFLFHYNAYDTDTGTLDIKAFNSYIQELKDKRYTLVFLYLQHLNPEKMSGLSEKIFQFNEQYFQASCTFRLRDEKLVMVFEDEKNKNVAETLERMINDFRNMYHTYKIDYRLVVLHSHKKLTGSSDYLALNEFIEKQLPINDVHHCTEEDVHEFLKSQYILHELRDIHLHDNLEDERILAYCQPVFNTTENSFTTAETLMRLKLPELGIITPDLFISLAEKHGYIHSLSKIILNKTCKQIKKLEKQGYFIERVSINFSITELRNENFCNDITSIIRNNDVSYDKIAVELTESRNEKDYERVKEVMTELRALGIKFYLDDFGTGYSNIARILGLPIDIIKFDRSLTILAGQDIESRFLVGSFSDIFKESGYQILFEGVEEDSDEELCLEMNALYLQGYKYSRPVPIAYLKDFLPEKE